MFRTIVIAFAVAAALAVPAGAFAQSPFITDTLGGNGTPHSSPWDASIATWNVITDTRVPVRGLITDTLGGKGTPHSSPFEVAAPKPVAAPTTGFSWGDAGIGAAVASALLALLAGSRLVLRRHERPAF